jgi:hypothetical protein
MRPVDDARLRLRWGAKREGITRDSFPAPGAGKNFGDTRFEVSIWRPKGPEPQSAGVRRRSLVFEVPGRTLHKRKSRSALSPAGQGLRRADFTPFRRIGRLTGGNQWKGGTSSYLDDGRGKQEGSCVVPAGSEAAIYVGGDRCA